MIDAAINSLVEELKQYIDLRFKPAEPKVVFSTLIDQDGSVSIPGDNRIVVSLVDIEEDRFKGYQPTKVLSDSGHYQRENHPIFLNIYLLFSAYFENNSLIDGIKLLSAVVQFFQGKYVFNTQNTPTLEGTNIEKLIVEMSNTSLQDKSYLWGMLGAKYLPSILYRVRLLTIQEELMVQEIPAIETVEENTVIK